MDNLYYPQAFTMLPTWEEIILDFNLNVQDGSCVKKLNNLGFVTHRGERIKKVKDIMDQIHKMRPEEHLCSAHIYISFLENSGTFGRHFDNTDVYFILALGSMDWIIETNTKQTFTLTAGDMVYLPKGAYHTPMPKSPRVGISVGFN
jgi:ribosomal protein L16 Arg81 hydroxylase